MTKVISSASTRLCMKKTSGAIGQGKMRGKRGKDGKSREEEKGEQRKREEEKEENETETVKRRCEGSVSVEAFETFIQGGDLESCGDLSWEDFLGKLVGLSDREPLPCELVRACCD